MAVINNDLARLAEGFEVFHSHFRIRVFIQGTLVCIMVDGADGFKFGGTMRSWYIFRFQLQFSLFGCSGRCDLLLWALQNNESYTYRQTKTRIVSTGTR